MTGGAITAKVNEYGGALLPQLLSPEETVQMRELYDEQELFRSTIDMGRHRFGEGQYRYLNAPYPEPIERLKQALYPRLLPIARDWWTKLRRPTPWPVRHGVSAVRSGERHTLALVFHDAAARQATDVIRQGRAPRR